MRIPAHEATTAQLGAVYPCVATRTLPADAVFVGRDVFGGLFAHDPFLLYAAGALTNPNMVVLGQIGRGKSAFVKSYLFRQAAFGRRVVVLDPKGEYGPFAQSLGAPTIALRPGGYLRLNPLDGLVDSGLAAARLESLSLVSELAAACLGRALTPAEHTSVELALAPRRRRVADRRFGRLCPGCSSPTGPLLAESVAESRTYVPTGGRSRSSSGDSSQASSRECSTANRLPESTSTRRLSSSTFLPSTTPPRSERC